ncbi:MAG: hypothetical protein NZ764_08305 [Marinobacter nauticus]|nr:hypothetical protein [Marinobacter nauticus]
MVAVLTEGPENASCEDIVWSAGKPAGAWIKSQDEAREGGNKTEIRQQGDSVQIRTTPSITIRDYEIGGGLNYEKPTSDKVELQIDQAKYSAEYLH